MSTADYQGISVHFSDTGTGVPVVLLHAGASSGAQWKGVVPLLGQQYRTIAPDLIGFGQTASWPGPDDLTHDAQAGLVSTVLNAVGVGFVHVVGHSYGGATALRFALQDPQRVRSLALIEPQVAPILLQAGEQALWQEYRSFAQRFIDLARQGDEELAWTTFIDVRNGPGSWKKLPAQARTRFLRITNQLIDAFASNLGNPTCLDDCRAISAPTLIVCGGATTAPDRRVTEILREAISNSQYVVIPEAGHMSPLTHPGEVAKLLLGHLSRPTQPAW
jgi:pimeloyl-ACP methyl ester carboxylesterase